MARPDPDDDDEGGVKRWLLPVGGLIVVVAIGWFLYGMFTATTGVKVEAPPPAVVSMVPPPPPPPPPPPTPHPPEPQDKPNPVPNPQPNPEPKPQAAPVSINGPAQAGSDAFGLQSGNGGGIGGGGTCTGSYCGGGGGPPMSEQFYNRYIDGFLKERIAADKRINRQIFEMDVAITIGPSGRITQVMIAKPSGKSDRDQLVKDILMSITDLDPPPSGMRFPQRYRVRGKRAV